MKIPILGEYLFFDEIPQDIIKSQKVFLTHSLYVNLCWIKESSITIYTTTHLAAQLQKYAAIKKMKKLRNIVAVKPFEILRLVLNNQFIEVIFFQSSAISETAMVLFRTDNRLSHFYAGNCGGHHTIYMNKIFNEWVQKDNAQALFVNLQRAEDLNPVEENVTIKSIENIIESRKDTQAHISVPLMGYAQFLLDLVRRLPARVHLTDDLKNMLCSLPEIEPLNLVNEISKARIIISGDKRGEEQFFKNWNLIEINLVESAPKPNISNQDYFEVQLSRMPTFRHLHLLTSIVKPVTIHDTQSILKVPEYLQRLCVKTDLKSQTHGQDAEKTFDSAKVGDHLPVFLRNKNLQFLSDSE